MAKARRRVSIGGCYRAWKNIKKWQRNELKSILTRIHENECEHETELSLIEVLGNEVRCLYKEYELKYVCDANGRLEVLSIRYCVNAERAAYA